MVHQWSQPRSNEMIVLSWIGYIWTDNTSLKTLTVYSRSQTVTNIHQVKRHSISIFSLSLSPKMSSIDVLVCKLVFKSNRIGVVCVSFFPSWPDWNKHALTTKLSSSLREASVGWKERGNRNRSKKPRAEERKQFSWSFIRGFHFSHLNVVS